MRRIIAGLLMVGAAGCGTANQEESKSEGAVASSAAEAPEGALTLQRGDVNLGGFIDLVEIHELKRDHPVAIYYSTNARPWPQYYRTGKSFLLLRQRPVGQLARECAPAQLVSCWDNQSSTTFLAHNMCTGNSQWKENLGYICTQRVRGMPAQRLDQYSYTENWGGSGWWRTVYAASNGPLFAPWRPHYLLGFVPSFF